jgi:hypothetical protein
MVAGQDKGGWARQSDRAGQGRQGRASKAGHGKAGRRDKAGQSSEYGKAELGRQAGRQG